MTVEQIFENNQKWVQSHLEEDKEYFSKLSEGQNPDILYIGCSDSRVSAEVMMGTKPGDVFVLRNVANLVPNNDLTSLSVINYAVRHLKVKHIIVCGHYYCGGVKAAMTDEDLGLLNPWLRNIRDVFRMHQDELEAIKCEEERYKRLIELNVQEQCINVIKTTDVQKAFFKRGIQIHGWVFDIKTGKLIDLKIDFLEIMRKVRRIYELDTISKK